MKRILSLFLFLLTLNVSAQEEIKTKTTETNTKSKDEKRLKPSANDWGFSFNISGLINDFKLEGKKDQTNQPILFFRHYFEDDLALRMGFGLNTNKTTTLKKDSIRQIPAFVEFDSTYLRRDVSFAFGIEKHLDHMRRLDPYFGADLLLQIIGKESISWTEVRNETSGKTTIEGERKMDGGVGVGVFAIAGFNYFITDHISLGAEYAFGYNYLKTGGNYSESIIVTPSSGNPTNTYNKGSNELKQQGAEVNSSANIVLSIFF